MAFLMRTIDRYVLREILPPFFMSLLIYTFILEIPPVMRDLEKLVAKGVSWGAAGRILLTLIPQGLGLTIPMATLTGILVGLGRLSGDREAVALLACGVSPYRLLRPVLTFAAVATAVTLYVMLQAIPDANQTFRNITFELVSQKLVAATSARGSSSRISRASSSTPAMRTRPEDGKRSWWRTTASRNQARSTWRREASW